MVESLRRPPESTVWECHGTGSCRPRLNHFQLPLNKNCARTSLGDPIEVGAVRKVGGATSDNHVPGIPPILEFNTIPFGYAAIYGHQYMATWQYVLWRCFKIWPAHNSVNRFFWLRKTQQETMDILPPFTTHKSCRNCRSRSKSLGKSRCWSPVASALSRRPRRISETWRHKGDFFAVTVMGCFTW